MSVSIIIPAHNEAHFITFTVNRLHEVLKDHVPYEVIIVENASTDGTRDALRTIDDVTVIHIDQKVTVSMARNIGIAAAQLPIIALVDADVLLTAQWAAELVRQIDQLRQDPLQITGCRYALSESPSWIEKSWFAHMRASGTPYINSGNLITTQEVVDLVGGFDPGMITGEDVDFCLRAARQGVRLVVNEQFVAHHEGYPRSLLSFFNRELWHGTGDFRNARTFFHSKVAIFSMATTIMVVVSVLCFLLGYSTTSLALLAIAFLANASAVNSRFKYKFTQYLILIFLHMVYCAARSTAIFRRQQV